MVKYKSVYLQAADNSPTKLGSYRVQKVTKISKPKKHAQQSNEKSTVYNSDSLT